MLNQYLFFLSAVLLGLALSYHFKKALSPFYRLLLALPIGLVLWSLFPFLFLFLGLPILPKVVHFLNGLFFVLMGLSLAKKGKISRDDIRDILLFLIVFSILCWIFLKFNYSILTNDSWTMLTGAEYVVSKSGIPEQFLSFYGILQYILLSSASFYGFDYLYALFPLMFLSVLIILYEVFYAFLRERGQTVRDSIASVSLFLLFPFSSFFVLMGSVYLSSNITTAFFLFLGFFALWKRLETGEKTWMWISAGMVSATGLLRQETGLFVLIYVILILSFRNIDPKEKGKYTVFVLAPLMIWFVRLALLLDRSPLKSEDDSYSANFLFFLAALYFASIIYAFFIHPKIANKFHPYLALMMLYFLAGSWTISLFTIGLREKATLLIVQRYGYFFQNILKDGYWGFLWIGLGLLFIILLFVRPIRFESLFINYIIAFALLYNIINLLRKGWRIGWGDSGNRILFHVLFVVVMFTGLKLMAFLFPKKV